MGKRFFTVLVTLILTGYPAAITNSLLHGTPTEDNQANIAVAHADESSFCKVRRVWVTAYTSTPEETDDTPFITANNTEVRDGIIAANFLPFGARIQIPEAFGDKIFTVTDRMHARKQNFVDIWMPDRDEALAFGIRHTEIVLLD